MGSESNLKTWVSDKLMSLLGYSQSTIVQYFIELAKKASSPTQVVDKLVEFGLSSSSETRAFAEEVFARVPHKVAGLNHYQKQEREAALLARKQKTYALLDADDDDDDSKHNVGQGGIDNGSSSIATSKTGKGGSRNKRFRKKSGSHEDEDEESVAHVDEERMVKRRTSHDEDGGSESEEERSRDQKEREELERHLKARDAAGTRKLTEPKLTRREEEEALRRSNAQERDDMEALRCPRGLRARAQTSGDARLVLEGA